jgi:hypothetical protein
METKSASEFREEGEVHEMRETLGTQKVAALSLEGRRSIAGEHHEVDDSRQRLARQRAAAACVAEELDGAALRAEERASLDGCAGCRG